MSWNWWYEQAAYQWYPLFTSSLTTCICPETLIFLNTEPRRMTGINDGNNNITVSTRGFFKVEAAAMHQEVRSVLVRQLFMKSRGPRGQRGE